jgi:hypothetical protein
MLADDILAQFGDRARCGTQAHAKAPGDPALRAPVRRW